MKHIQQPAVAGLFYPDNADDLRDQVRFFLQQAETAQTSPPKALIAPHAGYVYSGPVAGNAYALLKQVAQQITRVILLAPAHRMGFAGLARSSANIFRTPLGDIAVDTEAMQLVADLPQVHLLDAAFTGEHSIEVHLPFLQETLTHFRIVPLLVSDAEPTAVEEVLERLWGGEETLILISSDLSHFLDYERAVEMDKEATRAIEALNPGELNYEHACGRIPVSGLLLAARHHQLKVTTLDLRNSGDTAGPRDRVVGYGAYALY